jgi:hypothetical protein
MDADAVCHFVYEDIDLELYIQATPVACEQSWMSQFTYETTGYVRVDGAVSLVEADYNFGGRHHNDFITFRYEGQTYTLHQGSLGFGFRACAPPNCILLCEGEEPCDWYGGTTVDGCERSEGGPPPPLPVTCVVVNADGTVPPLLDPWTSQGGEDPLLPCRGDMTVY